MNGKSFCGGVFLMFALFSVNKRIISFAEKLEIFALSSGEQMVE